jgi:hypothetical protein
MIDPPASVWMLSCQLLAGPNADASCFVPAGTNLEYPAIYSAPLF